MKALILAAGIGSRLAPITDNIPKSLVTVNGKPILFKQIDNLLENGITDITIVAGYKAEILINKVRKYYKGIKIINSADYASTNNMYSAYIARSHFTDSEFLMMNADVFFDSSVITSLLNCNYPDAIVVDVGNYLEESMKVIEIGGRIISISKTISKEDALGASIDVYRFSKNGGRAFFTKCAEYIEQMGELKKWSEIAINDILKEIVFCVCPLNGRWFEIDNHDDLAAAENLFR